MKKEAHADSRRKGSADFLIRGMGPAPINQRFFPRRSAEKKGYADSRRKGDADFLINVLGLAPIDQRGFSVEIRVKIQGYAD